MIEGGDILDNKYSRDKFNTGWGFILACIGSAVGMGNIWMFPIRVHKFGGAAFLIPYLLFVLLIGRIGIIEEMSLGRAFKSGPLGAFNAATKTRGSSVGKYIGIIPVIGSFGIAVGYSVVVAWIIRFVLGAFTGSMLNSANSGEYFGAIAGPFGSIIWHLIAIIICFIIMVFGISNGIEKVNKIMMPAFFMLFVVLAIKIATVEGAADGYKYLLTPDWSKLANSQTWIYALGQSFFSLSLAGSGTVVYGSYLNDNENAPRSAKFTAIFDTAAAILAAMVIIPAIYAYKIETSGGPPLMFITMPEIFKNMYGGRIFSIIFFVAVLFAGITSLINLYETPVEMIEQKFKLSRATSVGIVLSIGFIVGIFIENGNTLGMWMDAVSIYIIPFGALLSAIMFSWICSKEFVLKEVSKGCLNPVREGYYYMLKYLYCGVTLAVYLIGLFKGSIG
ncbi:Sodium:neurotransmitter symporter family protein [Peptoniphilus sp. oral taxon 386 str. F0131]|nr:Sodium:neurotransmitter symporter family protein [Peptoniphilus sp. oral taxon 386 str. F0131]